VSNATKLHYLAYFEDPFWVGVVECQAGGALQAARHVFGAEPSPGEMLVFVQKLRVCLYNS
jgi:hypothetical protein